MESMEIRDSIQGFGNKGQESNNCSFARNDVGPRSDYWLGKTVHDC